ncbi:LysE family translocator [Sporolactobacillus shoreae]|uniref:LysE family translocator n=1 Tax=Sporolactobacillus shoreae TaxID=1465501 RepID=A0A4Z0GR05_9BACL|nr:LysE family translocator [Sporolactobacillus shoreae]TGA98967.1 LysE family translocator [Sporolactobacillus shoreae]
MVDSVTLVSFSLVALGIVCAPGPNMMYLVSCSLTQGKKAGFFSLLGVVTGFIVYVIATILGLDFIFKTVPLLYSAIKVAGIIYLLWMAWNAIKPGSESVFEPHDVPHRTLKKLYLNGLMTNLLNPKIAVLYISLLPQFEHPQNGPLALQIGVLGTTQIIISFSVNLLIVLFAGQVSKILRERPVWKKVQKYFMATILGLLALNLAFVKNK